MDINFLFIAVNGSRILLPVVISEIVNRTQIDISKGYVNGQNFEAIEGGRKHE